MGNKSGKRKKDPTILTQDDIETLVANTHFTPDQIRAWHVGFIKDCPKGELDKRKFTDVYKEFYPQGKADKFCAQVFSVFDADNSGKIDFTEAMYDTNKNGKIDKKEMEKIITAIYDLLGETNRKNENDPKNRTEAIFNKLDRDQNGNLTETEFVEGCLADPVLMSFLAPNT